MTAPNETTASTAMTKRWLWLEAEPWGKSIKEQDTVVTVFLVDPLIRLVLPVFLRAGVSPNQVTVLCSGISILDGWLFLNGHLALGGLAFFLWYVVDCIDGKIARLTDRCTQFGYWFDVITDRIGAALVAFGLATYFARQGDSTTSLLSVAFLVLWLLGSANASMLGSLKGSFNLPGLLDTQPTAGLSNQSNTLPPLVAKCISTLRGLRLNPWVFQEVEWLMIAFAVGPALGMTREGLIIASVAAGLQRIVQTAVFWWRRRKDISTC